MARFSAGDQNIGQDQPCFGPSVADDRHRLAGFDLGAVEIAAPDGDLGEQPVCRHWIVGFGEVCEIKRLVQTTHPIKEHRRSQGQSHGVRYVFERRVVRRSRLLQPTLAKIRKREVIPGIFDARIGGDDQLEGLYRGIEVTIGEVTMSVSNIR